MAKKKVMDVSIIIVNFNTTDLLIDCIHSIRKMTSGLEFEIIVVENGFGEDLAEGYRSVLTEQDKVLFPNKNLGFGKGNNLGAKSADGRYLLFLNPDTYLLNNAIKAMSDYLDEHPETGVVGGNLFLPDQSPTHSFCRMFDTPKEEMRNASWFRIIGRKLKEKCGIRSKAPHIQTFNDSNDPITVGYVFGADMMIRRDLFEELNGFDPDFFMYAEEEELSWRVSGKGYDIVNLPDAKIVHLEGAATSLDKGFNEAQFRMRMNGKLLYYRKCFGEEGQKAFMKARRRQYRRLTKLAKIRGKDIRNTDVFRMLACLEDEYQKLEGKIK